MVTFFVKLRAKPGCEDALCEGAQQLVPATRREAGVAEYGAYRSKQDPAVVWFFEIWNDEAAVNAHQETPHLKEFFALSKELLAGRPEFDTVTQL